MASRPTSAVFDGTPLEGAEVTGRLGGVIDTYGGQVIAELRKNEEFYAKANTSLEVAWDERQALIDERRGAQPRRARRRRPRRGLDVVGAVAPRRPAGTPTADALGVAAVPTRRRATC